MGALICTGCHRPYPESEVPYRCPTCGGVYDLAEQLTYQRQLVEVDLPGMWRYQHTFQLPNGAPRITLAEGDTPLVWAEVFDQKVAFKLEYLNPTGSFKDRGTALLISFLLAHGVTRAVEDSSGNAGGSFAAYAARAGIHARVFVPDYISRPKRAQIAAYGADVVRILGPRSHATEAVQRAVAQGEVYASHAYLPVGLPGFATIAYELLEQLGYAPGTIITPAGHGSLLLGIGRGFRALQRAGQVERLPVLVGVQARACAPLWAVFSAGAAGLGWVTEGQTLAEGVRISHPIRGDAVLEIVEESGGHFVAVLEDEILPGRESLARLGFYVEPTSAIVWAALALTAKKVPEPIIVVLTGSGFKSP